MQQHDNELSFGDVLKAVIDKYHHVSARRLAKLGKIDKGTISKIIRGHTKRPNDATYTKIIRVLKAEDVEDADIAKLQAFFQPVEVQNVPIAENLAPEALQFETKAVIDPEFVGREEAILALWNLVDGGAKLIEIQAAGGIGKTTLAEEFVKQATEKLNFEAFISIAICLRQEDAMSAEGLIEELLRKLGEDSSPEFGRSLTRLDQVLRQKRVLLLIDNLEPTLDGDGKFIPELRGYADVFKRLSSHSVRSLTITTTREQMFESSFNIKRLSLDLLTAQAWKDYFDSQKVMITVSTLETVHRIHGGNAKAMRTLCGEVQEEKDYNLDFEKFWEIHGQDLPHSKELQVLISEQFDRLRNISPLQYTLLVRMGCYRYQDIATIEEAGLFALLWEVEDKAECRQIIESLKKRDLIEKSQQEFYLHPVIREEALKRLKSDPENYKDSNLKAAEYLDKVAPILDTLKQVKLALESHRHYRQAGHTEMALNIIVEEQRDSKVLGTTLWRLGLISQTHLELQNFLIEATDCFLVYRLHNIVGYMFWMTGNPHAAIIHHLNSLKYVCEKTSRENINEDGRSSDDWKISEMEKWTVAGNQNLALCYLDLNELEIALAYVEKGIKCSKSETLKMVKLPSLLALKGVIELRNGDFSHSRSSLYSNFTSSKGH
jgi:plasmid maintenance system antidote protein VapI